MEGEQVYLRCWPSCLISRELIEDFITKALRNENGRKMNNQKEKSADEWNKGVTDCQQLQNLRFLTQVFGNLIFILGI